jgi:hypothetical protein
MEILSVMRMIKISVMVPPLFLEQFQSSILSTISRMNVSISDGSFDRIQDYLRYAILLREVDVLEI